MRAFISYAVDCLASLRDGSGWETEYHAEIWRLARLGLPVTRRARFDFRGIEPEWLRELIKRWLRWRISGGLALGQVRKDFTALTRMTRLVAGLDASPASLDRAALERYLAALAIAVTHPKTRSGDISSVATFLRTAGYQQWEPRLPASAVIYRGDHPRQDEPAPRALPESVMAQIENPASLGKMTDPAGRLVSEVLIRTRAARQRRLQARHQLPGPRRPRRTLPALPQPQDAPRRHGPGRRSARRDDQRAAAAGPRALPARHGAVPPQDRQPRRHPADARRHLSLPAPAVADSLRHHR
jgi:hypothetical protein